MDRSHRLSPFQIWEEKLTKIVTYEIPLRILAVLFFTGLVVLACISTALADGKRKPEHGDVNVHNEQFQSQGQLQTQGQSQTQFSQSDSESTSISAAVNEGLSQTVSITERRVKGVLGSGYADSDDGSTAPCLLSRRGVGVWFVSISGKTYVDEECMDEFRKQAEHQREMDNAKRKLQGSIELADRFNQLGRPDLATAILCTEAGMPGCTYDVEKIEALGGSKEGSDYKAMQEEISGYREKEIHGEIEK